VTNRIYAMTPLAVLVLAVLAQAQTFTTLYNFTGGKDGGEPYAGVIQDLAGNLYGTTYYGGDLSCGIYGCGAVYEVNTAGTEIALHSFTGYPSDGEYPETPVARDRAGNLYGSSTGGGSGPCYQGCGTVFKIATSGNETVQYSFTGGSDGGNPEQGLVVDKSGTVFGTTAYYGSSGDGTIFKVDSTRNFTLLHTFAGSPSDGANPMLGHLTIDKAGNLYGLTVKGGSSSECAAWGCGALYKLSKKGTLTIVHSFAGGTSDGCEPYGSVVQDKAGNLYGATYGCGANSAGTIWKVSKKGKETILHNFAGGSSDGCNPLVGVARDSKGNLYGVSGCGAYGWGALYKLSASRKLILLQSFDNSGGSEPFGEVLRTTNGVLFGTIQYGGSYGTGRCGPMCPKPLLQVRGG